MRLDDVELHLTEGSRTGSFFKFCEICKNTFFAEHHMTTASDYSGIDSSEGGICKQKCRL